MTTLTNGDFETGDLTGWAASGDGSVTVTSETAFHGTYSCKISNSYAGITYVSQDVDLTDVDLLEFWFKITSPAYWAYMTIDESWEWAEGSEDLFTTWTHKIFDVSGYTGVKTLSFGVDDESSEYSSIMYIDKIILSTAGSLRNGSFETGDLEGWNKYYDDNHSEVDFITGDVQDGTYALQVTTNAYYHEYIQQDYLDMTNIERITFWYKITQPLQRYNVSIDSNALVNNTTAATCDWTFVDVDVSEMGLDSSCIFQIWTTGNATNGVSITDDIRFYIQGEQPLDGSIICTSLITPVSLSGFVVPILIFYIRNTLHIGYPQEYDGYTDIGEYVGNRVCNYIPTAIDIGNMTIDLYHTEVGRSIAVKSFPDFASYGVKIIKHITNIMHMRMKRTK